MSEIQPQNQTNQTQAKPSQQEVQSQELKKCLYSICEPMCIDAVKSRPKDIPNYMINYLKSKYGYTSSGLRFDEQKELKTLRSQVEMFKDIEEHFHYLDQTKQGKKEIAKPQENKKGKNQLKPKARLPPEDAIISDEEDYKNLDDVDENLDNNDYIKACIENNNRRSITENCLTDLMNLNKDLILPPNIKTHKKTPELFEFIKINIIKSPVFSELNNEVLKNMIDAMEEKTFIATNDVIKQGDLDETFFFVVEGQLECKMQFTKITQEGNRKKVEKFEPKLVRIYNPGDYFGELSLLYHIKRRGTIKAITDVKLLALSRTHYKQIILKTNEERKNKVIDILKKVKILSMLTDEEFEKLEPMTKEAIYTSGETIIKENEYSNSLMILEKGKCIGTKTIESGKMPEENSKYNEGNALFIKAILRPEKSEENILAVSDLVKFICVDRYILKNTFGPYESILMRDLDYYQQIYPPEEKKEEEKPKEEEEKKEEEKKDDKTLSNDKSDKDKNLLNANSMSNNNLINVNKNQEEMIKLKEEHEKTINDYETKIKKMQEDYEKLQKLYNEQQRQNANDNMVPNNMHNSNNVGSFMEVSNNINMQPINDENNMNINNDPNLNQMNNNSNINTMEDKKSDVSGLLRDKLAFNEDVDNTENVENRENIGFNMNNQVLERHENNDNNNFTEELNTDINPIMNQNI